MSWLWWRSAVAVLCFISRFSCFFCLLCGDCSLRLLYSIYGNSKTRVVPWLKLQPFCWTPKCWRERRLPDVCLHIIYVWSYHLQTFSRAVSAGGFILCDNLESSTLLCLLTWPCPGFILQAFVCRIILPFHKTFLSNSSWTLTLKCAEAELVINTETDWVTNFPTV